MSEWEQLLIDDLKELFKEKNTTHREMVDKRNQLNAEIAELDMVLTRLVLEIDKRLRAAGHTRGEEEA
jgi:hypothetical protein